MSPILDISCSHDVKLSEPAKTRVPLTLSDGGIEPMDLNAGQLKILHFNSSEKSQEWTDITVDLDMLAVLKDRKVTFEVKNFCPVIIMFGCYTIVESAVQVISIVLLLCSKCSKYVKKDINDEYIL